MDFLKNKTMQKYFILEKNYAKILMKAWLYLSDLFKKYFNQFLSLEGRNGLKLKAEG